MLRLRCFDLMQRQNQAAERVYMILDCLREYVSNRIMRKRYVGEDPKHTLICFHRAIYVPTYEWARGYLMSANLQSNG